MENCEKCGGLMMPGAAIDFYTQFEFMKCLICGKEQKIKKTEYSFRQEMIDAK